MSKWLQCAYAHGYSSHIVATFGHYPTNGCHMREWWQLILTPVTTLLLPIYQGLTISKWWANFAALNSWTGHTYDVTCMDNPLDIEQHHALARSFSDVQHYVLHRKPISHKAQVFWEGHQNLTQSSSRCEHYLVTYKSSRWRPNFCGLLRIFNSKTGVIF